MQNKPCIQTDTHYFFYFFAIVGGSNFAIKKNQTYLCCCCVRNSANNCFIFCAAKKKPTFHYLAFHGPLDYLQPVDHDDRHFHKCHRRLDANVYAMNDAMNGHHAMHDHARVHDVCDGQMYEVNVADVQDVYFVLDVYTCRKRSGFHRRNGDDIGCCMTAVLWRFFVIVLIVD